MKKIFLTSLVSALVATNAMADSYVLHTNDCRTEAMHALLERAVAERHAVVTEIICDEPASSFQSTKDTMVYAAPVYAPVYEPVYVEPEYETIIVDYAAVPVVDCVPGPIMAPCNCNK